MIVDDDQDILRMIKDGLEQMANTYDILGASGGEQCFNLLEKGERPDIILLDIMMPEMSGWDVFAKLKENPAWRSIPIIFVTVKADPFSKGFGKMPADDYIEKPFSIQDLKERIDKIINR